MNKYSLKKKNQNMLMVFCYFCISVGYINYYPSIKFNYFIYILLGLFSISLILKLYFFKINLFLDKSIIYTFGSLIFFSSISSIYQDNLTPIVNYIAVIILFYLIFYFFQLVRIDTNRMVHILKVILIINIILILVNIYISNPVSFARDAVEGSLRQYFFRTRGMFSNPNLLARFISFNIIMITVTWLWLIKENKLSFKFKLLIIFNFLLSVPLIFATNSRTCIFALIVLFLISPLFIKFKVKINLKSLAIILLIFSFSVPGIVNTFLKFTPESQMASLTVKLKVADLLTKENYIKVTNNKGLSSYRMSFWKESISNFNFFGYENYSEETSICNSIKFLKKKCDVHNNYIHHINKFGLIPAIIFHLFFFVVTIKSIMLFFRYKNYTFLFSIFFGIFTLLFWIFETGTLVGSYFFTIAFFSIGISQQKKLILTSKI